MSATATDSPAPILAPGGTLTLSRGCEPSAACSTDQTRPALCHAYLRRRGDDRWLCVTDSFIAVALKVDGDAEEGFVPRGALEMMENGKRATQVSRTAWSFVTDDVKVTYDCGDVGQFPDLEKLGLWDEPTCGDALNAIGMNTDLMHRIGLALGVGNNVACKMEFVGALQPIWVTALNGNGRALQMPVKLNV